MKLNRLYSSLSVCACLLALSCSKEEPIAPQAAPAPAKPASDSAAAAAADQAKQAAAAAADQAKQAADQAAADAKQAADKAAADAKQAADKAATDAKQAAEKAVTDAQPAAAATTATQTGDATKQQAQSMIDRAKEYISQKKYQDALASLKQLSNVSLTPEQQKVVDDLKAQVQKLVAGDAVKSLIPK